MKRNHYLVVLLASLALSSAAFSWRAVPQQGEEDTQLGHYMEDINKAVRKLRSTLREPAQNAESLAMTRSLQLWIVQAKNETPVRLADVPEGEREAFLADYARTMCGFLRATVDLEEALIDGDNDKAQEIRNEINKMKSPAHERFKRPDEEGEDNEREQR